MRELARKRYGHSEADVVADGFGEVGQRHPVDHECRAEDAFEMRERSGVSCFHNDRFVERPVADQGGVAGTREDAREYLRDDSGTSVFEHAKRIFEEHLKRVEHRIDRDV